MGLARRLVCQSLAAVPLWVPPVHSHGAWYQSGAVRLSSARRLTLAQAFALIKGECDPAFLGAVCESGGRFLYRGEELPATAALLDPPPDLLQLDTYGSSEALAYFQRLERGLSDQSSAARPSSGHIAVARVEAAAMWGDAVSVWPLGMPLHYCWPRARTDFWPVAEGKQSVGTLGGAEMCNVDRGLSEALQTGREVLFAAERGARFVAISASMDEVVRAQLRLSADSDTAVREVHWREHTNV